MGKIANDRLRPKADIGNLGKKMNKDVSNLKGKAYVVLIVGILSSIILLFVLDKLLPDPVFGLSKFNVTGVMLIAFWILFLVKAIPRCPRCGYGLFSIIEIGKLPLVLKPWIGDECYGCGKKFSDHEDNYK